MGKPSLEQWSVDDWLGDKCVGALDLQAKGGWHEMLMLMCKDQNHSLTGTVNSLARNCRAGQNEMLNTIYQIAIHTAGIVEIQDPKTGKFEIQNPVDENGNLISLSDTILHLPKFSLGIPDFSSDIPHIFRITCRRYLKRYQKRVYDRERKAQKNDSEKIQKNSLSRARAGNGNGNGNSKTTYIPNPEKRGSAEGEIELTQNPRAWIAALESLRTLAATEPDYTLLLAAAERATYLGEDETDDSIHLAAANPADKFTLSLGRNNLAHFADVSKACITLASP